MLFLFVIEETEVGACTCFAEKIIATSETPMHIEVAGNKKLVLKVFIISVMEKPRMVLEIAAPLAIRPKSRFASRVVNAILV